jgi:uncharacterized protein (TIGR02145 family)
MDGVNLQHIFIRMKTLISLLAFYLITYSAIAQTPQKFAYQSVIRNAGNQLVSNQTVGIKISVLQGSANGAAVYTETHSPLTNANGLATLEIGDGTVLSGNFANINWASGPYFVKTETDLNGGSNYTVTNTQQLLSVPYALYSNTVSSSVSQTGDTLFIGSQPYVIPGISAANNGGGGQTGITTHTCGADSVHNPNLSYGSMTDQQGNVYKTIVIGTQEWMAENLKTSIYRNGEAIANITNGNQWLGLTTGAWCYYNNDSQYECPYGKLYNWYAVADPRNVCPTGWHVPTDAEWTTLTTFLGGVSIAGGKMKSTGTQYWLSPNQDATNESGFSGLPGGFRDGFNGDFYDVGDYGNWWSSSESSTASALYNNLVYSNGNAGGDGYNKRGSFSVRCLRD